MGVAGVEAISLTLFPAVPSDPINATVTRSGSSVAGSEFTLTCVISEAISGLANRPTAIWLNTADEERPVVSGDGITIATPSPGNNVARSTLTFNPLKTSHNRAYTCSGSITSLAENQPRTVSALETVTVQSKPHS